MKQLLCFLKSFIDYSCCFRQGGMEDEHQLLRLISDIYHFNITYIESNVYIKTQSQEILPGTNDYYSALGLTHMSIPYSTATNNWRQGVHYPFYTVGLRIISRHPIRIRNWLSVVQIFRFKVWMVLALAFIIMMTTCYFISQIYARELWQHEPLTLRGESSLKFVDIFFKLLSSLTEPEAYPWFTTEAMAGSVLIFSWSLGMLILNLSYNSILRSHLISPKMERHINSPNDALSRGAKIFLVSTYMYDNAGNPTEEIDDWVFHLYDPRLLADAEHRGTIRGIELSEPIEKNIMKEILDNGASVLLPEGLYWQEALKEPITYSRLRLSTEEVMKAHNWRVFFIRRFTPWTEDLDLAIMMLQDNGLIGLIFNPFLHFNMYNNPNLLNFNEDHPLKLIHMTTCFIFLACGLFVSLIIFVLE